MQIRNFFSIEQIASFQLLIFGLIKIPLIFFCIPKIIKISDNNVEVKLKLNYRTKNHLKSMYFGALSIGADVTGGFFAMRLISNKKYNISLIFKDFHADFLKRAEGDVHFVCSDGKKISALVDKAAKTGERQNMPVHIDAIVPSDSTDPIAKFILTLSLKRK